MASLSGRKAVSHERIVEGASRAVRRLGYQDVSVHDVMRAAQLTHGGFYAHFASRDALLAEAVTKAGRDIEQVMRDQSTPLVSAGMSPFRAFVEIYLSTGHMQDVDNGCPVSLLSSEMFRQVPEVAEPSRRLIVDLHARLRKTLPAAAPQGASWLITSALLGAVQLARALVGSDPDAAGAVLMETRQHLLERYDMA